MNLTHGEYYPRIWRCNNTLMKQDWDAYISYCASFRIVFNMLDEIFLTVEPSEANKYAYGHKLRHLLVITCTEIESAWVGVLKANNYRPNKNYTTNDYVNLCPIMRLNDGDLN